MMAGYISVPFFPTLTSKEINTLLNFGDVDLLFAGKVEDWEEQKRLTSLPIIAFPHYKGCSKIEEGHQWHAFIDQFEALEHRTNPNSAIHGPLSLHPEPQEIQSVST